MNWATLWATFSQTLPVTLPGTDVMILKIFSPKKIVKKKRQFLSPKIGKNRRKL
jgi:hypothetical protein